MSNLAPSLNFLLELRFSIENGIAIRDFLKTYCQDRSDLLTQGVSKWVYDFDRGVLGPAKTYVRNPYQEACLDLISAGLNGRPILSLVKDLEEEIWLACQAEMDRYLSTLPIKCTLALMLFQVPAFLVLLLGPIVHQLIGELGK